MTVSLLVLLTVSLLLAALAVVARMPRGQPALRTRRAIRVIGGGQVVIGALWLVWAGLYLNLHGYRALAGLYALAFGLLWCWQGLRRFA